VDNNQQYTTYVRVAQRVFVNYCIGFIITALIVAVTNCIEQSNQSLGQPTQSNQSLGQPTQSNQSLNRNKTLNYLL
jgi:hypothetical protein